MRPRGSGGKVPPVTPMSERQQMALLMQMTSPSNQAAGSRSPSGSSRSRDRNERGETPLHLAAIKGDAEQISKLLAHKADPNVTDFAGWTPLHEACNHGWYDVAFRLVQAGATVNARGLDDDTPLHDAAINGHQKLVRLLVDRGADVNAKNRKGKTPIDVAAPRVLSILLGSNSSTSGKESGASQRLQGRARDEKKVSSETKKCPSPCDTMDTKSTSSAPEDVYEFKSVKETSNSPDPKATDPLELPDAVDPLSIPASQNQLEEPTVSKRPFGELTDPLEDVIDEESKRKKRKDSDAGKDNSKPNTQSGSRNSTGPNKTVTGKPGASGSNKSLSTSSKSPCSSPKPTTSSSDVEVDDIKSDLKVPPLKIVIPQSSGAEQDTGGTRNGKNSSQRSHQALPYVVASSNSNDSTTDKEGLGSGTTSPTEGSIGKSEDKKDSFASGLNDEQRSSSAHHQRVLRSHRGTGGSSTGDRASNNSSPQLQRSHSPSPSASPAASAPSQTSTDTPPVTSTPNTPAKTTTSDSSQAASNADNENPSSSTSTSATTSVPAPVELHPRKRKLRPKEPASAGPSQDTPPTPSTSAPHPHEQPITNCYQLFLNIRKQIERRRKSLFPVQPKPPQGFKDYLMNRCTYVLARNAPAPPTVVPPPSVPAPMRDTYTEQEKERYKLRMQHVIEKEKLVLAVEQEILRVHGLAARTLANQALPFSVCTVLRDEEVYNVITPEQEEKDRNARSRYNGRLFLSWLQDVDDKWEKIKESMLLRHHNEAQSLHAVQRMDWEWKLKELSLCEYKATPQIDDLLVPMVHVSDDFDLLPA